MEKEKICLEYVFGKVSKNSLWNQLTTPTGLSDWFADDVSINDDKFIFVWNKMTQEAQQIEKVNASHVRFKWLDDENEDVFFEFRMHIVEVTGAVALEITDFVEPDEKDEAISLWDSQVKGLKRSLGI